MTTCPKKLNSCFDPKSIIPQLYFCQVQGSGAINGFCNQEGGIGYNAVTGNFDFPEATGIQFGDKGDCEVIAIGDDAQCSANGGGIVGDPGACQKNYNYGDPLNCCLRDYQCNDGTDIFGRTCFSDDTKLVTCPREFRAPDTQPCNYLTTQYCLGNYSNNPDDPTYLPPGIDFTALWVNTGIEGQPFEVKSLRTGTRYPLINDRPCTIEDLNPETGAPRSGTTCQLSGIVQAAHDQVTYKTGNTPICQQIFWRTLYGNSPLFVNQYWKADGGPTDCPADSVVGNFEGFNICENTSIPPQAAACQSTSFGGIPTPTGAIWAQSILTAAVNKLKAKGVSITNPPTTGADQPFLQWLYSVCQKYPNLCEGFVKKECAAADPAEFLGNQNLWDWCGCYMADERYQNYTDNFGVTKECSPYCNAPNTVPLVNGDTTQPLFCQQSVCIIDDVAINLVKSRFQDGTNNINFSQICNSCGSGYGSGINNQGNYNNPTGNSNLNNVTTTNCNCVIDNFTLTTINTVLTGDGINISQSCNGNSTCYNTVTNADGSTSSTPIDCVSNGISVSNSVLEYKKTLETRAANISIYWVVFGAIVLVCLIAMIWIFLAPRKLPQNDVYFTHKEIIEKPKPVPAPTSYNIYEYEINPPADLSPLSKKLDQNTKALSKFSASFSTLNNQLSSLSDQVSDLFSPIEFDY